MKDFKQFLARGNLIDLAVASVPERASAGDTILRLTRSCRFWSRVCMPICAPVWIAEYICAILFSRIRLRIAGVPIMISCAATRPEPSLVLSSVCEITARSDSESIARTISFSAAGNTSTMRSIVFAADEVCSVPNTRWPVSAPDMARRMVSRSRISPTRMISGSWRRAALRAAAKLRTWLPSARWLSTLKCSSWRRRSCRYCASVMPCSCSARTRACASSTRSSWSPNLIDVVGQVFAQAGVSSSSNRS